jgi:prevent-host-death family protein
MSEIGAHEAKTHLPKLLERVEQGERFTITRHGKPIAELVPVADRDARGIRATVSGMRKLRKTLHQRGVRLADAVSQDESLRDLTHSGHRY